MGRVLTGHSFSLNDIVPLVREAAEVVVEDHFTRCFVSHDDSAWNWNFYLFPVWALGILVRYFFLLPIRCVPVVAAAGCDAQQHWLDDILHGSLCLQLRGGDLLREAAGGEGEDGLAGTHAGARRRHPCSAA